MLTEVELKRGSGERKKDKKKKERKTETKTEKKKGKTQQTAKTESIIYYCPEVSSMTLSSQPRSLPNGGRTVGNGGRTQMENDFIATSRHYIERVAKCR